MAPCDFWVPDPGFIVEFDESQHFTIPRKLAFSAYPDEHSLGFSRDRWIFLCEKHNARDNDPPYRDEQRAWYDTLRDLIPSLEGLQPTVRIYASDYAWCSLDPDSSNDLRQFLEYLGELEEKYLALDRLENPDKHWTLDEMEQGIDMDC